MNRYFFAWIYRSIRYLGISLYIPQLSFSNGHTNVTHTLYSIGYPINLFSSTTGAWNEITYKSFNVLLQVNFSHDFFHTRANFYCLTFCPPQLYNYTHDYSPHLQHTPIALIYSALFPNLFPPVPAFKFPQCTT